MRYLFRALFAAAIFILIAGELSRASADTISTLNFDSTLLYGSAAGTLKLDSTTGSFTSGTVTASYAGSSLTFGAIASQSEANGTYTLILDDPSSGNVFDLYLPVTSLIGYTGGRIDTMANDPFQPSTVMYYGYGDPVEAGTLNLASVATGESTGSAAATPEVGTFVLLLTGFVPLCFIARRRHSSAKTATA